METQFYDINDIESEVQDLFPNVSSRVTTGDNTQTSYLYGDGINIFPRDGFIEFELETTELDEQQILELLTEYKRIKEN